MQYRLLKEAAVRALMEEDYDDVTQGELEDMGIHDPREAGLLPQRSREDELRSEVERKHGPDWEGWYGDGWYKDGKLYEFPPDGTIERWYDDGSADVWYDDRTHRMSKEEMEDEAWAEMPQRLPHGHDYGTSGEYKASEIEDSNPENRDENGYWVGRNRKSVVRDDMRDMWSDEEIDKILSQHTGFAKILNKDQIEGLKKFSRENLRFLPNPPRRNYVPNKAEYRTRWDDAEAALKRQKKQE